MDTVLKTCCSWPCLTREVGLNNLRRFLPTPIILWFPEFPDFFSWEKQIRKDYSQKRGVTAVKRYDDSNRRGLLLFLRHVQHITFLLNETCSFEPRASPLPPKLSVASSLIFFLLFCFIFHDVLHQVSNKQYWWNVYDCINENTKQNENLKTKIFWKIYYVPIFVLNPLPLNRTLQNTHYSI